MPEINKTYSGEGADKCAVFEMEESVVGLNKYNALSDLVGNEMKDGVKNFVFDFKNLNSINSSGLGILISCLKKIKDAKGSLKIVNANEKILNVFKLTKLTSVFEFEVSS